MMLILAKFVTFIDKAKIRNYFIIFGHFDKIV